MKFTLILLLLSTVSAWACPDLSGTYLQCESNANREIPNNLNMQVSMTNANSYLITINSTEGSQTQDVIADGIERERVVIAPRVGRLKLKVTATCQGDALNILSKTRVLGLKVEELSKFSMVGDSLKMDRIKNGRVAESVICR